jgi:hypothetical protein
MPLDPGEGVREGVVEDGRIHPAPVLVEDDGNFASLASTRRECDVGGGGGDLTEPLHWEGQNRSGTPIVLNILVVLAILEDANDEGT